jgi:putative flavoprotein involved in K+ transport
MAREEIETDVLVVGAGQAGIAMARALAESGVSFRVHEHSPRVGDAWRRRFDSLVLFTPRKLCALPGMRLDGDPDGYPTKDEIGDYLERYAEQFSIAIVLGNGIVRLSRHTTGFIALTASGGTVHARAVVIASGAFQRARIPPFATSLASAVRQLDTATYRNPSSVVGRRVTVVGDGATGRQIALELATAGSEVTLAMGHRRNFSPQRIFGKDSTEWALDLGLLVADQATLRGRFVRMLDATPGLHLRSRSLRRAGIESVPRCIGAAGHELRFADGRSRASDTVIFALGYLDETRWVKIDGAATDSAFVETRGVSPVRGLYYVGREWQSCRASALLCGVHRDAFVIASIAKRYLSGIQ